MQLFIITRLPPSAFEIPLSKILQLLLGYTKSEAGLLVAVSAALDLIGRLGFGYLSDLQLFDRKKAYIVW